MMKHEPTNTKSPATTKSARNIAVGSNAQYNIKRIAMEKNTMKMLDEKTESEIDAHDVVPFETASELIAFRQKNQATLATAVEEREDSLDQKTDVEKNIDEAERYINFIATQKSIHAVSASDTEAQKPLPSTTELTAFAPKLSFDERDAGTEVFIPKAGRPSAVSAEDAMTRAYTIGGGDMEPTRAYPIKGVTEQMKTFSSGGGITGQTGAFEPGGALTEPTRAYRVGGEAMEQTRMYRSGEAAAAQTRAYRTGGTVMDQTRAYQSGGAITESTRAYGVPPETGKPRRFDAYSDTMSEFQETSDITPVHGPSKKTKASKRKQTDSPVRFEYTSSMQDEKIAIDMEARYRNVTIRLIAAVFLSVLLFLIENIAPIKALFPSRFIYIIADWSLVLICAILVAGRLAEAFKSFFKRNPEVDCITVLAFLFSIAATTVAVIFENTENVITLYNFPFSVCVVLDLLFVYYRSRRDLYSFSILSSDSDKCAVVLGNSNEESLQESERFMNSGNKENVKFGEIKKVGFVDGYFAHHAEIPDSQVVLKVFIPFCLAAAAMFFCLSLGIMKYSIPESLGIAYATFMMCTPFSAFLAYCYPLYLASRRAHTHQSAILCDKTPDNYRDSSMLVFRDTEAIPAGKAKVKGIRLYGDKKIDNAIYYASSVYSVIGGPLEEVFRKAALNSVSSGNVQIREISPEGVCAMVDNKNIVIGRPGYMEEQCFETMPEPGDDEYDGKTNKRIFYLACDQFIIAKFYIQYSVSTDFLNMAKRLFSAGIGISVRTADPCLDDGIFYENKIDPEQHAIRISRACLRQPEGESVPASRAGIVSVGDVKELTKAFLVCRKLESVRRTNLVLHVIASVFAVAVMALVIFTGNAVGMRSMFPALYQLFWILPTYFVSKVYL